MGDLCSQSATVIMWYRCCLANLLTASFLFLQDETRYSSSTSFSHTLINLWHQSLLIMSKHHNNNCCSRAKPWKFGPIFWCGSSKVVRWGKWHYVDRGAGLKLLRLRVPCRAKPLCSSSGWMWTFTSHCKVLLVLTKIRLLSSICGLMRVLRSDIDSPAAVGQMMLFFWLFVCRGGGGWTEIWKASEGGSRLNPLCHTVLLCQRGYQAFVSLRIWPSALIWTDNLGFSLYIYSIFLNSSLFFIFLPLFHSLFLLLSPSDGAYQRQNKQAHCVFARAVGAQRGGLFHWDLDRISIHRGDGGLQGLLMPAENTGEVAVRVEQKHNQ